MKSLIENKDLVVISRDKDSCAVILKSSDYHCVKSVRIWSFCGPYFPAFGKTPNTDTFHAMYDKKLQSMVDEGITNGAYTPTTDTMLNDLKNFQDFLHCNFKDKFTHYKDMRPVSNQPGRLYATAVCKLGALAHFTLWCIFGLEGISTFFPLGYFWAWDY